MINTPSNFDILNTGLLVETVQKLSLAKNLQDIMQIVRSVARKLTGADGATFVLRDGNLCYYADEDAISPLWKGSRFPMENCISGWVMLNKTPAIIEEIYSDPRIPADAYRPTFVKSLVMVPIRTMKPLGAIGNYWAKQHKPTNHEVAMLQALADITAVSIENVEVRNTIEEKLSERTDMLMHLNKQKEQLEEFTHIIAHNMRAPLSNLLLLADMIRTSENLEEKLIYINKQQPVLDFLHQTFEELVNSIYVKTDFTVTRDHIELEESFHKTLELLHQEILTSEASVTNDFSKAKTAYFPKKYIDSILFNLLDNALKFRAHKRKPIITITTYKNDGWTWLEIQDNGLGIDLNKHRNKIFMLNKTFHQHPNAKGFGLFITKTQIEAMGGEINIKSTPDVGTTFTIKLNQNK
jgi:signal transduction histidine kinase